MEADVDTGTGSGYQTSAAFFCAGESMPLPTQYTSEDIFRQAETLFALASSGILENPEEALERAESLLNYAAGLSAGGK
ncbi:hypothetical protein M1555_01175 [Patescibacteria group bacterium]|nr:hypothetical protein [Patescibacteria group bacterium]